MPRTTQSQEATEDTGARFDPRKTYVIGELKKNADFKFPEHGWLKKPMDVPGRFFTGARIRSIDNYFERNPHSLPMGRTFVIYERTQDGGLEFLKSGSFLQLKDAGGGGSLADGQRMLPDTYYGNVQQPPASDHRVIAGLRDIVDVQASQTRELMERNQEVVNALIAQNQQILERYQGMSDSYAEMRAAAEVERAKAEHERFLAQFKEEHRRQVEEECAAYYKEMEKQRPTGLSDPAVLQALIAGAPAIVNMLKDLFSNQNPPPTEQRPATPAAASPIDPGRLTTARNGSVPPPAAEYADTQEM